MKINIKHIAKLANLKLTITEEKKFENQLSSILDYIKKLDEINTDNVEPISQTTGLENVTRKDIAAPSLSQEETLSNTSDKHNGYFVVPAVLND